MRFAKTAVLICTLAFAAFAQVDPDSTYGIYTNFDEEDIGFSVVGCDEGADFFIERDPEGESWDSLGVFATSSCDAEGFQCDQEFAPMDFSARSAFHVHVIPPAEDLTVAFKIFEKDNPDNNEIITATTTKAGEWDTLSFDFSHVEAGVYNMFSIHPDFGSDTAGEFWYFNAITVARMLVTYDDGVLLDFDQNPNYMFFWDCNDGFAEFDTIENPQKDENNDSETVGFFFTSTCTWEGCATAEKFVPFDFSEGAVFTLKVLAPAPDETFMFKIENFDDNTASPIEVQATTTTNETWETLAFDFSGAESNFYGRIALFPGFGNDIEDIWYFDDVKFTGMPTGVEDQIIKVFDYQLAATNYPNPFNPTTTIEYTIPKASRVTVTVHDLMGRRIQTLVDQTQPMGDHFVEFDGSQLASGMYFYTLQAGTEKLSRKMLIVK